LWRRSRPKLGCGAKEGKKERKKISRNYQFVVIYTASSSIIEIF
jgi:hypothetical protein